MMASLRFALLASVCSLMACGQSDTQTVTTTATPAAAVATPEGASAKS